MSNFYVNGEWFIMYHDASVYADKLRKEDGKYRVVFTKAEMDSIKQAINHEMECGK